MSFKSLLLTLTEELATKYDIELAAKDVANAETLKATQQKVNELERDLSTSKEIGINLLKVVHSLDSENKRIKKDFDVIKTKSLKIREKFVTQIGSVLRESHQINVYKKKIQDLERQLIDSDNSYQILNDKYGSLEQQLLTHTASLITHSPITPNSTNHDAVIEHIAEREELKEIAIEHADQYQYPVTESTTISSHHQPLLNTSTITSTNSSSSSSSSTMSYYSVDKLLQFDKETLLHLFSFLSTPDILHLAETCRMLYKRVDQLFGGISIDDNRNNKMNKLIQDTWDDEYKLLRFFMTSGEPHAFDSVNNSNNSDNNNSSSIKNSNNSDNNNNDDNNNQNNNDNNNNSMITADSESNNNLNSNNTNMNEDDNHMKTPQKQTHPSTSSITTPSSSTSINNQSVSQSSGTTTSTTPSISSSSSSSSTGKIFPSQQHTSPNAITSFVSLLSSSTSTLNSLAGGGYSGMSHMNLFHHTSQPKLQPSSSSLPSSTATTTTYPSTSYNSNNNNNNNYDTTTTNHSNIIVTKEISDGFSKKLNTIELKAIVNMSDTLKRQDLQLSTLRSDKDDLESKLQNTETVRDFLVEKLHSAEMALKQTWKDFTVVKKQSLADQEVIAFLDVRGQELEKEIMCAKKDFERLQTLYDLQCGQNNHTERQLQNEVDECRTRLENQENIFKTHKKVLIKEVKSLRFQLEQVTSERQIYRVQLQALRDALLNSTQSMNVSPS